MPDESTEHPTIVAEDAPLKEIPPGTTHFFLLKGGDGDHYFWPDENGVGVKHLPIIDFSKSKIIERWGYQPKYGVRFLRKEGNTYGVKGSQTRIFGLPAPLPAVAPVAPASPSQALSEKHAFAGDLGQIFAVSESLSQLKQHDMDRAIAQEQERNRAAQETQREGMMGFIAMMQQVSQSQAQMQAQMMAQVQQNSAATMQTIISVLSGQMVNPQIQALQQQIAQMQQEPDEETDDEVIEEAFTRMATGDVMGGLKEIALKRGGKKVAQAWPMIEAKAGELMAKIREAPAPQNGRVAPQIVQGPPNTVGVK